MRRKITNVTAFLAEINAARDLLAVTADVNGRPIMDTYHLTEMASARLDAAMEDIANDAQDAIEAGYQNDATQHQTH